MSNNNLIIIGAGISGLIAFNFFKKYNPVIIEKNTEREFGLNNHSALFRIKDSRIPLLLGLNARKISISKSIYSSREFHEKPTIKMANEYSIKTNGTISKRSILNESDNGIRYLINKEELIKEFIKRYKYHCHFGCKLINIENKMITVDIKDKGLQNFNYNNCINTTRVDNLLQLTGNKLKVTNKNFKILPIYTANIKLKIKCNVNQTVYIPDRDEIIYRMTLQENKLIIEGTKTIIFGDIISLSNSIFGLRECDFDFNSLKYEEMKQGKIREIEENNRRNIIFNLTKNYHIYSLGRFAIWKNITTNDLMQDCEIIERFINFSDTSGSYDKMLKTIDH